LNRYFRYTSVSKKALIGVHARGRAGAMGADPGARHHRCHRDAKRAKRKREKRAKEKEEKEEKKKRASGIANLTCRYQSSLLYQYLNFKFSFQAHKLSSA
jgi:hypothetical protein